MVVRTKVRWVNWLVSVGQITGNSHLFHGKIGLVSGSDFALNQPIEWGYEPTYTPGAPGPCSEALRERRVPAKPLSLAQARPAVVMGFRAPWHWIFPTPRSSMYGIFTYMTGSFMG